MHITDYERVNVLEDTDVFLIDGLRGTKTIGIDPLREGLFKGDTFNQRVKGNIKNAFLWGGRFLGTHITDEQVAAIDSGDRTVVTYGDYWETEDGKYRFAVMDFDHLYNNGRLIADPSNPSKVTTCTIHHAVIMCVKGINKEPYDTSGDISTKGYANCSWRTKTDGTRAAIKQGMLSVFNMILTYSAALQIGVDSDNIATWGSGVCDVELPSVEMLGFNKFYDENFVYQPKFIAMDLKRLQAIKPLSAAVTIIFRDIVDSGHVYGCANDSIRNFITVVDTNARPAPFAYVR